MAKQSKRDQRGKRSGKSGSKRRDPDSIAIANAEQKLVRALADLDDARATLSKRQRQLADLLAQHGHLPTQASDAVPLFDQTQRITDVNEETVRAMLDEVDLGIEHHAGAIDGQS